jgi:hypothetical protein
LRTCYIPNFNYCRRRKSGDIVQFSAPGQNSSNPRLLIEIQTFHEIMSTKG